MQIAEDLVEILYDNFFGFINRLIIVAHVRLTWSRGCCGLYLT